MGDLVDRQEVINLFDNSIFGVPFDSAQYVGAYADRMITKIKRMSPAQSRITMCEDCKYLTRWRSEESALKYGQIYECKHGVLINPQPQDFCSHAERREK